MAYKTEELYKKAIEICESGESIHFIDDVIAGMPCTKKTFYNHFNEDNLHCLHDIKEKLELNRIATKQGLRKKWETNDNATLQLALYKLTGTEEERQKISQAYNEIKIGGDKKNPIELGIKDIEKIIDKL